MVLFIIIATVKTSDLKHETNPGKRDWCFIQAFKGIGWLTWERNIIEEWDKGRERDGGNGE